MNIRKFNYISIIKKMSNNENSNMLVKGRNKRTEKVWILKSSLTLNGTLSSAIHVEYLGSESRVGHTPIISSFLHIQKTIEVSLLFNAVVISFRSHFQCAKCVIH